MYCAICDIYRNRLAAVAQRFSNNFCPKFTDEECMTVYIFGIIERKPTVKAIHAFAKDYYADWFPELPDYPAFNKRVCYLNEAFMELVAALVDRTEIPAQKIYCLLDSMPVVVAKGPRSGRAKVAADLCDKGYNATKDMYFYGVKLHSVGLKVPGALPLPLVFDVTRASVHDLPAAKDYLQSAQNMTIVGDKAFCDESWRKELKSRGIELFTPIKPAKGQQLDAADRLFSSAVSRAKQAIESFFNWIQERTNIQSASRVRSGKGLISFLFARLAAVCFLVNC